MFQFLIENVSSTTAVLALTTAIIAALVLVANVDFKALLAPGPWGLPILGFYPFVRMDCHVHLSELSKKYGEVYLVSMCGRLYLHLNTQRAVREVFVAKSDCFAGRGEDSSVVKEAFKGGVVFNDGEAWKVQRKFWAVRLRDLSTTVKEKVHNPYIECSQGILNALKESQGQPIDINNLVVTQCSKIFQRFTIGDNVSEDTVQKLRNAYVSMIKPMEYFGCFLYGKIARFLATWKVKTINECFAMRKELDAMYHKIIKDHRETFDPNNPKDLIDHYLLEKKLKEERGDPSAKYFTDDTFVASILTMYGDADVTVGELIAQFIKHLAPKTDVQDAIYKEICDKIGTERAPTYDDRNELLFTYSAFKELERVSNIFPFLPSLECSRETTVLGVYCPTGTIAITNFFAINNDPSVYKDPETFNPKRFLPDEKTGRPKEALPLTFGIGKRACLGEALVMAEVFIFLTAILQQFSLKLPDDKPDTEAENGAAVLKVITVPRQ